MSMVTCVSFSAEPVTVGKVRSVSGPAGQEFRKLPLGRIPDLCPCMDSSSFASTLFDNVKV